MNLQGIPDAVGIEVIEDGIEADQDPEAIIESDLEAAMMVSDH